MNRRPKLELNDWQTYQQVVSDRLQPNVTVLDVGCGRGGVAPLELQRFAGVRLIGADVDASAGQNPTLDAFVEIPTAGEWPIESGAVDLVLARYVLEHVERPEPFVANVRRVLKPGGAFVFLTPHARHPAIVVSRILPIALKRKLLSVTGHAEPDDVYPTFYRLNTASALHRAAAAGFTVVQQEVREYAPCGYLDFFTVGRALARAYRKALVATGIEAHFGAQIIGVWRKAAP